MTVMSNQLICKKAKFWLKDGVLYCVFIPKECEDEFKTDFLEDFLKAVATLSKGSYFPLLIDLRQLKNANAFSVVKTLSKNPELKSAILSKSFVVNTFFLQVALIVFKRIYDPVIPNKIFKSYDNAIKYSLETNYIFNS